ncbi:MAG: O-methyltransferase [Chloroflexota bacterium]
MKSDTTWLPTATDLDWIDATSGPPHPALLAIEAAAEPDAIPILDRASGRVLAALVAGRKRIVEVGTAFGYSTLWMALALPVGGTIVTIDPDRGRTNRARGWWREASVPDERITVVNAPALVAFAADEPALRGPFDLAFIDALKPEYGAYLEAIVPRLAPGALVVADNVLWSGRVSGERPADPDDEGTSALRAFNESMLRDPRFAASILPVGDGLLVAGLR